MENNTSGSQNEKVLSARDRRRQQLEDEFSFEGFYAIRKELYADLKDPAMTIRDGSICFNNACISSLENVMYIETFFNDKLKRFALFKSRPGASGSLRWCSVKNGKRSSRKISCPDLTSPLYSLMNWDKKYRYRVLGYLIEVDNQQVYVFDFKYYKMFRVHPKKGEPGHDDPIDRKGTFSEELLGKYGMPMAEYLRETEVIEKDGYVSMAALTGPHEPEKVDDETGTIKQLVLDDLVTPNGKDQGMESNVMSHTEQSSERDGGMHV